MNEIDKAKKECKEYSIFTTTIIIIISQIFKQDIQFNTECCYQHVGCNVKKRKEKPINSYKT